MTASLGRGALAGVTSVTLFTVAHQIFVSPIWFLFPVMAVAGAVCGACLAWCYSELVRIPSNGSWAGFVALFTAMFGLLAAASLAVFDPVYSMAEIIESSGGNPIPLADTAGLMIVFTAVWAGALSALYRGGWRGLWVAGTATAVLMVLLGFNVSTIGLVEIPKADWLLVAEFFGFVILLAVSYGVAYGLIRTARRRSS